MTLGRPEAVYADDEYRFLWKDLGVEMVLERFSETKDDIRCELMVQSTASAVKYYSGRLLLIGPNSIRDVVSRLNQEAAWCETWSAMVQQARDMAKERFRIGEPSTDLRQEGAPQAARYLVRPFLLDRGITMFFGSEESAKSLFMLALGVVVASGESIADLIAEETGTVGYLDWEDDATVHRERMLAICTAADIDPETVHIEHKRMTASLAESAREVKTWLGEIHARLVIIDSLGMAGGGDPNDPQLMIRAMMAARSFNLPIAAIHHLPKDARDKSRPYGTVYAAAESRMTWLVEKDDDASAGQLRIALTNKKSNRSARHPRQSFEFTFQTEDDEMLSVAIKPLGFTQAADIGKGAGQKWRIAAALKRIGPSTIDAVAAFVELPAARCRTQLNRHKTIFTKTPEGLWSLLADDGDTVSSQSYPVLPGDTTQGGFLIPPSVTPVTEWEIEEEEKPPDSQGWPF